MSVIKSFSRLITHLTSLRRKPTVAVVCPYDEGTCAALVRALSHDIIRVVLVGQPQRIDATGIRQMYPDKVEVLAADDASDAATKAVELVRRHSADILMKGLIGTDQLLHAVLNKTAGILPVGGLLSHLSATELPGLNRLLFFSDVAVIPYPTPEQRHRMLEMDLEVVRKFGIEKPKVALIHFTEKTNPKFPNSVTYSEMIQRQAETRCYGDAILGGPMDVKTALDAHSAQVKGIVSEVCGNADLLIFPNIESGNTFYKTVSLLTGAPMAGMLMGTDAPVVLPSRSDSADSKFCSLALAAIACV